MNGNSICCIGVIYLHFQVVNADILPAGKNLTDKSAPSLIYEERTSRAVFVLLAKLRSLVDLASLDVGDPVRRAFDKACRIAERASNRLDSETQSLVD